MDFINRVIAVFGEWRKGSVFNVLITLARWFNTPLIAISINGE
jgi:hypothetical protein